MENYEKLYKEALERARKLATDLPNGRNDRLYHVWDLESIFPELKESKNERNEKIKKEVINMINYYHSKLPCFIPPQFSLEKTLAWLEKQATPQLRTGPEWVNTIDDACDKRYSEEYAHGEYCHEQSFKWGFKEGVEWLEKQGEQKLTDEEMIRILRTEYEKGRFDMREEMMKALVNSEIVKDIHNQLSVKSEPLNDTFRDIKFGDKVKIIIVKTEQQ